MPSSRTPPCPGSPDGRRASRDQAASDSGVRVRVPPRCDRVRVSHSAMSVCGSSCGTSTLGVRRSIPHPGDSGIHSFARECGAHLWGGLPRRAGTTATSDEVACSEARSAPRDKTTNRVSAAFHRTSGTPWAKSKGGARPVEPCGSGAAISRRLQPACSAAVPCPSTRDSVPISFAMPPAPVRRRQECCHHRSSGRGTA